MEQVSKKLKSQHFQIKSLLGSGSIFIRQSNLQKGFGKVYAAVDERGKYFAIKRVPVSPTT